MKVHRIHASQASGLGGNSFNIEAVRWRGEGGDKSDKTTKREMARRVVVCWNVCEGWPTQALEDGCLREVDEAAEALLKAAMGVELPDTMGGPGEAAQTRFNDAIARLKAAFSVRDPQKDWTDGRAHDCEGCLGTAPVEDEDEEVG